MNLTELEALLLSTLLTLLSGLIVAVAAHWLALARDKRREARRQRDLMQQIEQPVGRSSDCDDDDIDMRMHEAADGVADEARLTEQASVRTREVEP